MPQPPVGSSSSDLFDGGTSAPPVERVDVRRSATPKLAEILARRIELDIANQAYRPGTVIGTESDLIANYKVSRAVVREAIRLLEHYGVALMRRGPGGGLTVTEPDGRAAALSSAIYLNYSRVTPTELWEARTLLESATVRLAANRIDEVGLDRIENVLQAELEQLDENLLGVIDDFHIVVAELSENTALKLFVDVLIRVTEERSSDTVFAGPDGRRRAEEAHSAHRAIADAIANGDVPRAVRRMEKHLTIIPMYASEAPDE